MSIGQRWLAPPKIDAEESDATDTRADDESDEAVSARHAEYESQGETQADEPLDMDKAFDEAEADQRRLESDSSANQDEPASDTSGRTEEGEQPSTDSKPDAEPDSPSEPSPKKPDSPV